MREVLFIKQVDEGDNLIEFMIKSLMKIVKSKSNAFSYKVKQQTITKYSVHFEVVQ